MNDESIEIPTYGTKLAINQLSRLVDELSRCVNEAEKVQLRLENARNKLNDVVYKLRKQRENI